MNERNETSASSLVHINNLFSDVHGSEKNRLGQFAGNEFASNGET